MNVASLYSHIPHEEGIQACRNYLHSSGFQEKTLKGIHYIINVISTINNFEFDGHHQTYLVTTKFNRCRQTPNQVEYNNHPLAKVTLIKLSN